MINTTGSAKINTWPILSRKGMASVVGGPVDR